MEYSAILTMLTDKINQFPDKNVVIILFLLKTQMAVGFARARVRMYVCDNTLVPVMAIRRTKCRY